MLCEACQLVDFRPPSLRGVPGSTLRKISLLPRVLWDNCSHLLTDNPNIASFYHRHHSSLDSLRDSAERGCQLCRLFLCGLEGKLSVSSELWAAFNPVFPSSEEVRIYPYHNPWGSLKVKNTRKYSAVIACGEKMCAFGLKTPSAADRKHESLGKALTANLRHSTGSPASMALIRHWVQECDIGHGAGIKCLGSDKELPLLPTRVIDVGPPDGSYDPFLFISQKGHRARYIALSHCWGTDSGKTPLRTTQVSLADHQKNIPMASLPQTFFDSVSVVRNLGVRYLWIDSLCIVQDLAADWEFESSRMGDYYWNSSLTIAAADSIDSSEGLFADRDSAALYPCATTFRCGNVRGEAGAPKTLSVQVHCEQDDQMVFPIRCWIWDHKGVLDRRGWCLQEKVLSARILTFDRFQISFTCQKLHVNEAFPSGSPQFHRKDRLHSLLRKPLSEVIATVDSEHDIPLLYTAWRIVVEDYWTRDLTHDRDILPAISGLASRVKIRLVELGEDDDYLAGMWKRDLRNSLCWYVWPVGSATRRLATTSTTSSWSWASLKKGKHDAKLGFEEGLLDDKERLCAEFVKASTDVDGPNPFRTVTGGTLIMKCKVQEFYEADETLDWIRDKNTGKILGLFYIDDRAEFGKITTNGTLASITFALVGKNDMGEYSSLVLVQEGVGDSAFYRRIGYTELDLKSVLDSDGWFEKEIVIR